MENKIIYDINCFTIREMTECAQALRTIGEGSGSMEEAANKIVRHLYECLIDGETGNRATVLVRFFKTHSYIELDAELQDFARNMLGDAPFSPDMKCMVLLATAGDEPRWNARRDSKGHKAIPLPSEEAIYRIPMFLPLIDQFGMNIDTIIKPDLKFLLDLEQKAYNVYHVPEPLGNPYIPAQKEFVIPYGVKSIIGFGGLLPSGNMYAVPIFFKVPVSRETAELFRPLSLSVKLAILPYQGTIFARTTKKPSATKSKGAVSRIKAKDLASATASLQQLMEVYEKTVVEQSDNLYREIAERKAAERELDKYRIHLEELVEARTEELERSNRELEQFAFIASHDLKSPILALAANLKLIEKKSKNVIDTESQEMIKDALSSTTRMQALIKDLLSYARVGANGLKKTAESINLGETIKIVQDNLKAECERVGCIITAGEMPKINADLNQMIQLFQNLVSNAIKFKGEETPPQVEISAYRADNGWLISVKDNGIGIPDDQKDKIFEIFYRAHVRQGYGGTGVGLAICKKIVERHHGRIWVESEPGKGTTFYFTIPD